jgi:hypothetical protein
MNQLQVLEYFRKAQNIDLLELNEKLQSLSLLFKNLPVSELEKKNWLETGLKHKSAWYACCVNTHIDVLLLPEFLENKQSRNILLKKETEQYLKSFSLFESTKQLTMKEKYEAFVNGEVKAAKANHFDLFSSQATEQVKCPEKLNKLFLECEKVFSDLSSFEKTILTFSTWHLYNKMNLSNQRQMLMWMNEQLQHQFGDVSKKINLEEFLFTQWNDSKKDWTLGLQKLVQFFDKVCEELSDSLKQIYKDSIGFNLLKSNQKLVVNHLFNQSFEIQLPEMAMEIGDELMKQLKSKGFITRQDIKEVKQELEAKRLLSSLVDAQCVEIMNEGGVYFCINPSISRKSGRLEVYANIKRQVVDFETHWQLFLNQKMGEAITVEMPIFEQKSSTLEPQLQVQVPVKKKVFFG